MLSPELEKKIKEYLSNEVNIKVNTHNKNISEIRDAYNTLLKNIAKEYENKLLEETKRYEKEMADLSLNGYKNIKTNVLAFHDAITNYEGRYSSENKLSDEECTILCKILNATIISQEYDHNDEIYNIDITTDALKIKDLKKTIETTQKRLEELLAKH